MIVLDSSFLIGFYNDRDAHHAHASLLMRDFLDGRWGKGLLLEYVYLEVVTVLLVRIDLTTAASVAGILLESEETRVRSLFGLLWRYSQAIHNSAENKT